MPNSPAEKGRLSQAGIDELLRQLGPTKTFVLQDLDRTLPWYRSLSAAQRASLGELAQQGVQEFITWLTSADAYPPNPPQTGQVLRAIFGGTPFELSHSITLRQAAQLVRALLQAVEAALPDKLSEPDQSIVREAVLRYTREIAFALADVYARAAEQRGAWDTRLEALLLDAILRGERSDDIHSRAAALGWRSRKNILALIGRPTSEETPNRLTALRQHVQRQQLEVLIGEFSEQLILILGRLEDDPAARLQQIEQLTEFFAPNGPIVYGPIVADLADAHSSAQQALAGFSAVCAWPQAPRPVSATELLPERALNQDPLARRQLIEEVYRPLAQANPSSLDTVETYFHTGHSLEATARAMFIHANTVRYRLKQVATLTGYDPLRARDAYILQIAISTGRLAEAKKPAQHRGPRK